MLLTATLLRAGWIPTPAARHSSALTGTPTPRRTRHCRKTRCPSMAKHVWSVLCYKGVVDQFTNQVSLLDVTETVVVKLLEPVPQATDAETNDVRLPMNLHLVTLWIRSNLAVPEECDTRVRS